MPTKVKLSSPFKKNLRKLAKKYAAVLDEFEELKIALEGDERLGEKIPNVHYDVYKVRLKNPSAQKGKSGGFRVVYYLKLVDMVVMLSIYSKSEQTNISANEIAALIDGLDMDDEE